MNQAKVTTTSVDDKITFVDMFLSKTTSPTNKVYFGFVLFVMVFLNIYHLYAGYFGPPDAYTFRSMHLTLLLTLTFMTTSCFKRGPKLLLNFGRFVDILLIVLTIACQVYISYDVVALSMRIGDLTRLDMIMGTVLIVLVIEAARRVIGWSMVAICLIFLIHTLQAHRFIGFLFGPPSSWARIIDIMVIQEHGIYGIPIMVSSSYIMLFLIFGAILVESKAGLFFTNIALALAGRYTGGPAKASVVASGFMATLSGAAVANVVMTGSFTIPLMKKIGYRPHFAAGVEAAASSGGLIMPPLMGAAAFIMAMFLGRPYLEIAIAGAVPGFLYFFSIFWGVHFEAKRLGLKTLDVADLPQLRFELKRGGHLFLSIIALIIFLAIGRSVAMAAFWTIICAFFLAFLRSETRPTPVTVLRIFEKSASTAISVAISCAAAGIVVGSVFCSGVGVKFSGAVISLAHGQLWLALILTMLACIVLGTGLTVTAVYVTMAALTVPALIELGVSPLAAHFFCFYFGVASGLTPPVCIPAYVAAGVAGAPPMKTGVSAFFLGIAKYLLPFMFVFSQELFLIGPPVRVILSIISASLGIILLCAGISGFFFVKCSIIERLILIIGALALLKPGGTGDIIGYLLLVLVVVFQWPRWRKIPKEEITYG